MRDLVRFTSYETIYWLMLLSSDMDIGEVVSMRDLGVTESYKLKKQVVVSASEAAEMILRYVDIRLATLFARILEMLTDMAVSTTFFVAHHGVERACESIRSRKTYILFMFIWYQSFPLPSTEAFAHYFPWIKS